MSGCEPATTVTSDEGYFLSLLEYRVRAASKSFFVRSLFVSHHSRLQRLILRCITLDSQVAVARFWVAYYD